MLGGERGRVHTGHIQHGLHCALPQLQRLALAAERVDENQKPAPSLSLSWAKRESRVLVLAPMRWSPCAGFSAKELESVCRF